MIYASSATIRLSQRDLLALLKLSRAKNEACGLTGMLLYRDGTYLQFLEGQRSDVDRLFTRLQVDRRHSDVRLLREGVLPKRLFPEWSMAYKNLAGVRSSDVAGYSELLQSKSPASRARSVNALPPGGQRDAAELLVEMFQEMLITS